MGLKHRITTLGAAIGVHQLARAADIEARRRSVLDRIAKGLAGNPVITPVIVPAESGQHGLYVIGLRFCPQNASVTRDEFVAFCVAEGATEVDAPGSTRDISGEPLFARRDAYGDWDHPGVPAQSPMPGVAAFQSRFIKLPAWGYGGDNVLIEAYLAALSKVSEAVAR
jgi:dTDP-4-amino-4,6-dideoxygalactose transaminase